MTDFEVGDRVRIDIPDETNPDHDRYHGRHGTIIALIPRVAEEATADDERSQLVRVDLDDGDYADFRFRDLRPPITG